MSALDRRDEQISYYRARAHEYDQWWRREGRWDLGSEHRARWFAERRLLGRVLDRFSPEGRVLELACGTGNWTAILARYATAITAVDASPEVIELNRAKLVGAGCPVEYITADLFSWRPAERFDLVFFSFWLSHVPPSDFDAFWRLVDDAIVPGGRFFFIEDRPSPASPPSGPGLGHHREPFTTVRRLTDGREFRIVKVFYEPDELVARLARLGWAVDVESTGACFTYGYGRRDRA